MNIDNCVSCGYMHLGPCHTDEPRIWRCPHCPTVFTDPDSRKAHPCESPIEKAVREEREAVLAWLRRKDNGYILAAACIERGEHRK